MEKTAWIHHLMVSQHMTYVQAEQYYEQNLKYQVGKDTSSPPRPPSRPTEQDEGKK